MKGTVTLGRMALVVDMDVLFADKQRVTKSISYVLEMELRRPASERPTGIIAGQVTALWTHRNAVPICPQTVPPVVPAVTSVYGVIAQGTRNVVAIAITIVATRAKLNSANPRRAAVGADGLLEQINWLHIN